MNPPELTSTPSPAAVRRKVRRRRLAALVFVLIAGAAVVWWWMPDKPARLPGLRYWTSPSTGMDFVYIAPGTFMMGSPDSEEGRGDDETQHEVTITKGFWLGVTEVTEGQWKAVMGGDTSFFKGPNYPVDRVGWDECQTFIAKLCEIEGVPVGTYRLPTEAQWEYACRAGTIGPFAGELDEMAWYIKNSSSRRLNLSKLWEADWSRGIPALIEHRRSTAPVGRKKANTWGLYDMHGNVPEWCEDGGYEVYREGYVVRGGCSTSSAKYCRSASRSSSFSSRSYNGEGFRLLRLDSSFPNAR